MSKIPYDKYYTPYELAKYCVEKTKDVIGEENITEYIEPSAGNGVFLKYLDKQYKAYDILPEGYNIIKQDYLTLDLEYKKGRCIIGNPPYGNKNTLSVKFYKKAIKECDYISFILPISQFNNNIQMYEFDLIYSEDLGYKIYSNINLHCCLNIYKRPKNKLNKKPNYKLKDITILEYRRNGIDNINLNYDYAMCAFGAGLGKEIIIPRTYSQEVYFYIHNDKLKDKILYILKTTDWKSMCKGISNIYRLPQWKIYKYLKEQIPEIN